MLIGILSDTHDQRQRTAAAVEMLHAAGARYFVHCGDVGSPAVLDELAGHSGAFVLGNCDWDRGALQRYAGHIGLLCLGEGGELELDGKHFAIHHGDKRTFRTRVLAEQRVDYLLEGHSHILDDQRVGKVRLINPGALHRAAQKTVALLDPASDQLRILVVPD